MQSNNNSTQLDHQPKADFKKENTVFLTGLCGLVKSEELQEYLETRCSGIISVTLPNKRHAGYAFVELDSKENVNKFLGFKNLIFNDRKLQIRPYVQGEDLKNFKDEVNSRRIFVSKIPKSWADGVLKEFFLPFGELETAYIIRKRQTKKSKGFGYVVYKNKETALKVASLNKILFKGAEILVKMHEPKDKRLTKRKSKTITKEQAEEYEFVKKSDQNDEENPLKIAEEDYKVKMSYSDTYHWVSPTKKEYYERGMDMDLYSRPEEYELSFELRSRALKRRAMFNKRLNQYYIQAQKNSRIRVWAGRHYVWYNRPQTEKTTPMYF